MQSAFVISVRAISYSILKTLEDGLQSVKAVSRLSRYWSTFYISRFDIFTSAIKLRGPKSFWQLSKSRSSKIYDIYIDQLRGLATQGTGKDIPKVSRLGHQPRCSFQLGNFCIFHHFYNTACKNSKVRPRRTAAGYGGSTRPRTPADMALGGFPGYAVDLA